MPNLQVLSARNPLGIIALFISLIYGVCALLLGFSVGSISATNQERLVLFVIAFPFIVLFSFLYLVTWHHRKLYAPADFRTDEGFYGRDSLPEDLGPRLIEQAKEPETPDPAEVLVQPPHVPDVAARSFLAEGLVFQELQRDYQASVRREVMVGSTGRPLRTVDGILESRAGNFIVEIKVLRRRSNAKNVARDGLTYLHEALGALGENSNRFGAILCLVAEPQVPKAFVNGFLPELNKGNVEIKVFELVDLLERYRITPE